ncbi:ribosomal protein 63, mitochondrial [Lingula anatina]|uniref:Ribosomal protein 63, mitochondrial n=1 Tax=Lingula anatina TaxID=7574 RepID=A0A1S3H1G0_LINAN|nr:ribosomal protein 63, mitochondrial [Lingula anatina]|eukprot:XP_013379777.1 ribosomal protein 63, mitochondrial [Lingula anatina]
MHLTGVLGFYKRITKISGMRHRGKHRIIPQVTPKIKMQVVEDVFLQKRNLDILEKPYITKEQEYGHMAALGKENASRVNFKAKIVEEKRQKFCQHRSLEDQLEHLNNKKAWE